MWLEKELNGGATESEGRDLLWKLSRRKLFTAVAVTNAATTKILDKTRKVDQESLRSLLKKMTLGLKSKTTQPSEKIFLLTVFEKVLAVLPEAFLKTNDLSNVISIVSHLMSDSLPSIQKPSKAREDKPDDLSEDPADELVIHCLRCIRLFLERYDATLSEAEKIGAHSRRGGRKRKLRPPSATNGVSLTSEEQRAAEIKLKNIVKQVEKVIAYSLHCCDHDTDAGFHQLVVAEMIRLICASAVRLRSLVPLLERYVVMLLRSEMNETSVYSGELLKARARSHDESVLLLCMLARCYGTKTIAVWDKLVNVVTQEMDVCSVSLLEPTTLNSTTSALENARTSEKPPYDFPELQQLFASLLTETVQDVDDVLVLTEREIAHVRALTVAFKILTTAFCCSGHVIPVKDNHAVFLFPLAALLTCMYDVLDQFLLCKPKEILASREVVSFIEACCCVLHSIPTCARSVVKKYSSLITSLFSKLICLVFYFNRENDFLEGNLFSHVLEGTIQTAPFRADFLELLQEYFCLPSPFLMFDLSDLALHIISSTLTEYSVYYERVASDEYRAYLGSPEQEVVVKELCCRALAVVDALLQSHGLFFEKPLRRRIDVQLLELLGHQISHDSALEADLLGHTIRCLSTSVSIPYEGLIIQGSTVNQVRLLLRSLQQGGVGPSLQRALWHDVGRLKAQCDNVVKPSSVSWVPYSLVEKKVKQDLSELARGDHAEANNYDVQAEQGLSSTIHSSPASLTTSDHQDEEVEKELDDINVSPHKGDAEPSEDKLSAQPTERSSLIEKEADSPQMEQDKAVVEEGASLQQDGTTKDDVTAAEGSLSPPKQELMPASETAPLAQQLQKSTSMDSVSKGQPQVDEVSSAASPQEERRNGLGKHKESTEPTKSQPAAVNIRIEGDDEMEEDSDGSEIPEIIDEAFGNVPSSSP